MLVLAALPDILPMPWVSLTTSKRIIAGPASERAEDVRFLAQLAEARELKPVIARRYPLERIADAHRYVDAGHKKGSVAVTVNAN